MRAVWRTARVLVGALFLAWLFRACVAEPYRIPTASMAGTLLPGDYVLVSKLGYGGPIAWSDPERGDVVAFAYPPQPDAGVYVKRVAGLPGDTVALAGKRLRVNGRPVALPPEGRLRWRVSALPGQALPYDAAALRRLGPVRLSDSVALVHAAPRQVQALGEVPEVAGFAPDVVPRGFVGARTFPDGAGFSRDFYGPLRVPARGDTVVLSPRSWPRVRALLGYEGRRVRRVGVRFEEDGEPVERVVLRQDYYFVIGDSRDDSEDSRAWGWVPRSHLRGRVALVYFSSGADGVRWSRIGQEVR